MIATRHGRTRRAGRPCGGACGPLRRGNARRWSPWSGISRPPARAGRLREVLDHASDAVISIDQHQQVHFFNQATSAVFGVARDDALGMPLGRFIPQDRQLAHRLHVESFRRTGSTARRMGRLQELAGQRANGEVFPIEATISRSGEGDNMLMTVVCGTSAPCGRPRRHIRRNSMPSWASARCRSSWPA